MDGNLAMANERVNMTEKEMAELGDRVLNKDRVCDECGSIHKNGIDWHGRCYHCGGELVPFNFADHELTAVTPKGIEIYEKKD